MARTATKGYHNLDPDDLRWILVEAKDRILGEETPELATHTLAELRERNIDVRLSTTLESATDRLMLLSDGSRFAARTLVWTAGIRPAPVLSLTDLPLDGAGRITCLPPCGSPPPTAPRCPTPGPPGTAPPSPTSPANPAPRTPNTPWPRPDCSPRTWPPNWPTSPSPTTAPTSPPAPPRSACAAPSPTPAAAPGSPAAAPGGCTAPASCATSPTRERRIRVLTDWLFGGLFQREIVSLGTIEHPRAEFESGFTSGPGT